MSEQHTHPAGGDPIALNLGAEILHDADTGRYELVVSTGTLHSALMTPGGLREQIARAKAQLEKLAMMADRYEGIPVAPSPCYSWCDHDDRFPGTHESAPIRLEIPAEHINWREPMELITAALYTDDDSIGTTIHVDPPGGLDGGVLDAVKAEAFADSIVAFAARIRHMARQARETRPALDVEAVAR